MHILIDCVVQLLILERANNPLGKNYHVALFQSQDCMRFSEILNDMFTRTKNFLTSLNKLFIFDHQAAFCAIVMGT